MRSRCFAPAGSRLVQGGLCTASHPVGCAPKSISLAPISKRGATHCDVSFTPSWCLPPPQPWKRGTGTVFTFPLLRWGQRRPSQLGGGKKPPEPPQQPIWQRGKWGLYNHPVSSQQIMGIVKHMWKSLAGTAHHSPSPPLILPSTPALEAPAGRQDQTQKMPTEPILSGSDFSGCFQGALLSQVCVCVAGELEDHTQGKRAVVTLCSLPCSRFKHSFVAVWNICRMGHRRQLEAP